MALRAAKETSDGVFDGGSKMRASASATPAFAFPLAGVGERFVLDHLRLGGGHGSHSVATRLRYVHANHFLHVHRNTGDVSQLYLRYPSRVASRGYTFPCSDASQQLPTSGRANAHSFDLRPFKPTRAFPRLAAQACCVDGHRSERVRSFTEVTTSRRWWQRNSLKSSRTRTIETSSLCISSRESCSSGA